MELRDADRCADDVELGPLDNAAHQLAVAENTAAFSGWQGTIAGISETLPHQLSGAPTQGRTSRSDIRAPAPDD